MASDEDIDKAIDGILSVVNYVQGEGEAVIVDKLRGEYYESN